MSLPTASKRPCLLESTTVEPYPSFFIICLNQHQLTLSISQCYLEFTSPKWRFTHPGWRLRVPRSTTSRL